VGTIVLIQVRGDLKERAQLSALKVFNNDSSGTIFFKKPNKAGVEVNNLGNSFVQPFGKVTITNTSGKQIYAYNRRITTGGNWCSHTFNCCYATRLSKIQKKQAPYQKI
jgi:hypothetical protein